jgi:phospholipase C
MDTRRDFLTKASVLAGGAGLLHVLPASIAKALAIDPAPGSTFMDAEHIVFLMQENRSFDHTYGTLQGVRGFNDPRAITLPDENLVWLQTNKNGETYAPFRFDIKNTKITWMSSLPHSWSNQVDARNEGKYDRWLDSKPSGHEDYAAMPLTMGFYSRADIPFYYSLADAFTVCDQNFCSSLTGTTPNRLYFWSGTIREKADANVLARVWNEDADYDTMVSWKTFPERMQEWGVSWKIYQNELSVGVGFEGEEDAWLSNFGDNPLEYFTQYHVKLHPEFINALPKVANRLAKKLEELEKTIMLSSEGPEKIKKMAEEAESIKKRIAENAEDQKNYTMEKYNALPAKQKELHQRAFVTNRNDPFYHQLTTLKYKDGTTQREMKVPKGDVLHQFRKDVESGQLPTVSWLVAPENFSDHPGAAWYGAWYISEAMDILTKNPEVWKKTIFILTYDENDGYYDHVPPFVAPNGKKNGGAVSDRITDEKLEYVANEAQQSIKDHARESSIGLGYRVPLVIASPWSRGGWVNSEVFDHTSSLRFLEKFLGHKLNTKIEEPNITAWRRAVCGDLTSAFRPYNNEDLKKPKFLDHDDFVESIHKAQFKNPPANFKKLTKEQVAQINKNPRSSALMPSQEKGTRSSCALPYELYVDGNHSPANDAFVIRMEANDTFFKGKAAGSPFLIYVPAKYGGEQMQVRSYAVAPGEGTMDKWAFHDFENGKYHLKVYGPNGFFREFSGVQSDSFIMVKAGYELNKTSKMPTGNLTLDLFNSHEQSQVLIITDNAYKNPAKQVTLGGKQSRNAGTNIVLPTGKSKGWYDFSVKIKGNTSFERRFAGRVETGLHSITDPLMGGKI